MGIYIHPSGCFLPTSGGTVSGQTSFTSGLTANSISGNTIYSGGTNLYSIFAVAGSDTSDITRVQGGTNVFTGGTDNAPTINITSAVLLNLSTSGTNTAYQFSATTVSGGTIYSGNTNLYDIFVYDGEEINGGSF